MAPKAGTKKNTKQGAPEKPASANEAEEAASMKTKEKPVAATSEAPKAVVPKISLKRTARKAQPKEEVKKESKSAKQTPATGSGTQDDAVGAQGKVEKPNAVASEAPKAGLSKPFRKHVGKVSEQKKEVEVIDLDNEEPAPDIESEDAASHALENVEELAAAAPESPKAEVSKPSRKRNAKKEKQSEEAEAVYLQQDIEEPKTKKPASTATKGKKKETLVGKENKTEARTNNDSENPAPSADDVDKVEKLNQLKTQFQDLEREFVAFAKSQQKQMKDINNLMMHLSGK